MRLLAFTDIHSDIEAFADLAAKVKSYDIDLIVCAGDFTFFGSGMEQMLELMNSLGKPIILVHGNHEDEYELAEIIHKYKNIKWIHKDTHEYKNFIFVGFGGGGFEHEEPEFRSWSKKFKGKKNMILLTHQPPHGTLLDQLFDGSYSGNIDFRKFIDNEKPVLAICGHIHENTDKHDIINNTFILNPGPRGKIVELDHDTKSDNKKKNE